MLLFVSSVVGLPARGYQITGNLVFQPLQVVSLAVRLPVRGYIIGNPEFQSLQLVSLAIGLPVRGYLITGNPEMQGCSCGTT